MPIKLPPHFNFFPSLTKHFCTSVFLPSPCSAAVCSVLCLFRPSGLLAKSPLRICHSSARGHPVAFLSRRDKRLFHPPSSGPSCSCTAPSVACNLRIGTRARDRVGVA
ncbi:hypothetical protein M431DRAFT_434167 [Trichoderma harzianum CBS 226.95]|uniref:Uncharacterized protein n=1 Tax=Trichoderma harzianum CBS 226.95 TaxID=983964 RepID=A0A2T4AD63_TRIHA|nr:hypothetical protein M431DRAFT_434167 [Trichoderma harzianum CBS 226.95]PTB54953.1 hypothetical protein M431DRAFT_434167 [Trichoderma harzianum CBS 226.95]